MKQYTPTFFDKYKKGSIDSANEIVPIIIQLINPLTVIDVGCGIGTWLSVFKKYGIKIHGLDGGWLDQKDLLIPSINFDCVDLEFALKPIDQYDLVMSLEVAEHLPEKCAKTFVKSLTSLGPVVLFSAAAPQQGGRNHLNEQWPEYWVDLFEHHNYVVIDCIREQVWNNKNVEFWYAQNTLLFVDKNYLTTSNILFQKYKQTSKTMLSIVHPRSSSYSLKK